MQLRLDPGFLSGDVDLFASEDLLPHVEALKLGKGHADPYIEVVPPNIIIASPLLARADFPACGGHAFLEPDAGDEVFHQPVVFGE